MDEIDRPNRSEDKLFEQLLASPVVELSGVVSPSGVGAGKLPGERLWSLLLSFDTWRINGGPIRTESLTIRRRVTDEELREFHSVIKAETVIRIRARVAEENVFGTAQAYIEEHLGFADDNELRARLDELHKATTIKDDQFGIFSFNRSVAWYEAQVEWAGQRIHLHLNAEEPDDVEPCLKIARDIWSQQSSWKNRIEDHAVQELLELKNDAWLDDEETEVSSEEFRSRMTLKSISIYPDGHFDFWHDDGDLFWGHSILVAGSIVDGPTSADIPG